MRTDFDHVAVDLLAQFVDVVRRERSLSKEEISH